MKNVIVHVSSGKSNIAAVLILFVAIAKKCNPAFALNETIFHCGFKPIRDQLLFDDRKKGIDTPRSVYI